MSSARKIFIVVIVFMVGSVGLFVLYVLSYRHDYNNNVQFDNVVVLTGGHARIAHAFSLIESCHPKNIFISGVYEKTTLRDILPSAPIKDVRIILGKQAKNTEQNAKEINEWVVQNNISEILLVTSDYHLIRSMLELRCVNPELKVHPCVVNSSLNIIFFWRCFKEFHKVIYIQCRILLEKIKKLCCS
ncbi:MAG: YdcF family protein [Holosporaceae bacterium]|jgi:uncharacterized SAM-binding protein YcdF (DUF218 family)|nr:YdcF family protein [Holosporaceae bacterium]